MSMRLCGSLHRSPHSECLLSRCRSEGESSRSVSSLVRFCFVTAQYWLLRLRRLASLQMPVVALKPAAGPGRPRCQDEHLPAAATCGCHHRARETAARDACPLSVCRVNEETLGSPGPPDPIPEGQLIHVVEHLKKLSLQPDP
ncbi:hypothetical protein E5288_WYG018248 [Bos mutus]|uniref:Uncharacterized protein n=1 Tax=Bos mutus TaxID=72004 RepID=A0A6B0S1D4_9CETA|nr:hypothetical protein [Bos mutus]